MKYLTMERCREGTLQQQNTNTFAAMMPEKEMCSDGTAHRETISVYLIKLH